MDTVYPPSFIANTHHGGADLLYLLLVIWLTLANREISRLTGTMRNAPQKIHPPDITGIDTNAPPTLPAW